MSSTSFSFGQRLGIFMTIEATVLSAVSVTSILLFALYKWVRRTVFTRKRSIRPMDASDSSLFLNLMLADLVQAIGNLPNIRWMADAHITEGPLCTAQSAIKQVGIVGVAATSLAIAFHTFAILVLRWRAPRNSSKYIVLGIWVFTALVIGIPNAIHRNVKYYGNTGFWCWILADFKTEQIVTEYLWVWFAGFSMVILYGIMFVVMRGWFIIDRGIHWHESYEPGIGGAPAPETEEEKETKQIANLMLFYPAVYIICFLPNTIARWLFFSHITPAYQYTLFAATLYALSGVFNLVLFLMTRPELVVGQNIVVEEVPLTHHKKGSSIPSSNALGHLPTRAYQNSLSDVNKSPSVEEEEFDPRILAGQENYHQSPQGRYASLPTHGGATEYLSVDRNNYRNSRGSSSLAEEEDYGHLPH